MPLPVETSGQSQSLSDFVQEENKQVKQKINQTRDEDDSLHFDVENFSEHSEDDEPMMDIVSFTEIELDEEVEYISNPDRVLKNLRQSLQIMNSSSVTKGERPPEIPLIPSMGQIRIAVWYQQNGEWQYSTHLEAGNEITFKGIGVWVDNTAALLLTGSANVYILVKGEDGVEKEYSSINGTLQLPPKATVLIQHKDSIVCFRPE